MSGWWTDAELESLCSSDLCHRFKPETLRTCLLPEGNLHFFRVEDLKALIKAFRKKFPFLDQSSISYARKELLLATLKSHIQEAFNNRNSSPSTVNPRIPILPPPVLTPPPNLNTAAIAASYLNPTSSSTISSVHSFRPSSPPVSADFLMSNPTSPTNSLSSVPNSSSSLNPHAAPFIPAAPAHVVSAASGPGLPTGALTFRIGPPPQTHPTQSTALARPINASSVPSSNMQSRPQIPLYSNPGTHLNSCQPSTSQVSRQHFQPAPSTSAVSMSSATSSTQNSNHSLPSTSVNAATSSSILASARTLPSFSATSPTASIFTNPSQVSTINSSQLKYLGILYHSPDMLAALLRHHNFTLMRSPMLSLEQTLGQAIFSPDSRKASFQLVVPVHIRDLIQPKTDPATGASVPPQYALHLRIFGSDDASAAAVPKLMHIDNSGRFTVYLRGMYANVQSKPIKSGGVRKHGLVIVPPSDISAAFLEQTASNAIIHSDNQGKGGRCYKMQCDVLVSNTTPPFYGQVVVELSRIRSASEISQAMMLKTFTNAPPNASTKADSASAQPPPPPPPPPIALKECVVCKKTQDLQRCSRCKNAWYCTSAHQTQDWPTHSLTCKPALAPPASSASASSANSASGLVAKSAASNGAANDDGDVVEVEATDAYISMKCPLSILRIRVPAKGAKCQHPQCFDAQSFLEFCNQHNVWQCPVCQKAIDPNELIVDHKQSEIIKSTSEDIEKICVSNGEYIPMTDEQIRAREAAKRASKRPANEISIDEIDDDGDGLKRETNSQQQSPHRRRMNSAPEASGSGATSPVSSEQSSSITASTVSIPSSGQPLRFRSFSASTAVSGSVDDPIVLD